MNDDQGAAAELLPGASGWDPGTTLRAEPADPDPGPDQLGRVGPLIMITGADRFAPVILKITVDAEALTGIDPGTVRVLHPGAGAGPPAVIGASGCVADLGYVWATVTEPGAYFAAGLPWDPVLRSVAGADDELPDWTRTALRDADPERIEAYRTAVVADLAATSTDPRLLSALTRVRGGGFGLRLPGDGDPAETLRRVADDADRPEPSISRVLARDRQSARLRIARDLPGVPATANWSMFHRDPEHSGIVQHSHIDSTTVGALQLRSRLPLDGPIVSAPAIVDNTVYVGIGNSRRAYAGRGGTLYAIDLIRGVVRNSYTFNTAPLGGSRQGLAGIACTPAVTADRIYFSGQDGRLYCLDRFTLRPVWITDMRHADPLHQQPITHQVNAEGWCSPLVVNGRVYVGWGESESDAYGFLYCLDAASGVVVWLLCTTLFPGLTDNPPNVVPRSAVGMHPLPSRFLAADDPADRGGSPWSSCAYDPATNRIVVGTGNVLPQEPLPQPKYSLGVLSVDADTGANPRFFQPVPADNYRPDDSDVDMAASPLVFSRGNRRVVAIGSKNGSFFLLDAVTLEPLARRQLLPRAGGNGGFPGDRGRRIPAIDPRVPEEGVLLTENFYGTFSCPVVHAGLGRIYVGVGGFAFGETRPGIDTATTPFIRAMDWEDLTDAWATASGPDQVRRYVVPRPPLYQTPGEAGFSSPVLVNDLVLLSTSRPALYAFAADTGLPIWRAPGLGPVLPNSFTLGPAVYGDFIAVGSANLGLLTYSL
ncbi:PQQ-binding-like beta-propeller repeat protein [Microlunatus sp. GCM10028923]|uniref:outer membrane protein assembly factor BamB family protein n=1 Tax=Microlunatus sp. GCM10028923 TaxID=3273400 RepID=UPI00361FF341